MPGFPTKVEVTDPRLLGQRVWENLLPSDKALLTEREFISQEWVPLDRRRFRIEPESYRTQYSLAGLGTLRALRIAASRATQFTIRSPVADAVLVTVFEQGTGRLVLPGSDEPAIGNAATGVIRGSEPGTRSTSSDASTRLNLWLPAGLLRRKLETLLDGQRVETVAFQPSFDQTRGAGATIRRMIEFLFAEFEHSDSLLANEIAIRSFEDNLALALLLGLPHEHSAGLQRQKTAAAPGNVKRAEAFMRAHAAMPLTIAEIAAAAGCGVRALQLAFQRFRGTTPMRALQQARLEQARTEMLRPDRTDSLARIAAGYGFSNPTRFARLFRSNYGLYPSEMLRPRRDLRAGQRRGRAPEWSQINSFFANPVRFP